MLYMPCVPVSIIALTASLRRINAPSFATLRPLVISPMQPFARKTKMAHLGASIYQPDEDYGCTTYPRAVLLEAPLVASPVRQRALQVTRQSCKVE